MNEEILERIAQSLERIAICMENKQAREINKSIKERKKANSPGSSVASSSTPPTRQ